MSWRDRRLAAISQAGLVAKFVDALVWVFYPLFLYHLPEVGWIVGVYGFVWGGSQFFTGRAEACFGSETRTIPCLNSPPVSTVP